VRARARKLEGRITIVSAPGQGTRVTVLIPQR
jgi:signal transduction histidine kinase